MTRVWRGKMNPGQITEIKGWVVEGDGRRQVMSCARSGGEW